jgi:hypothetical protein
VSNTMVIYHGILNLEKVGTVVDYHGIFITLGKNFNLRKRWYHGKLPWYFYNIDPRQNLTSFKRLYPTLLNKGFIESRFLAGFAG